jgi:hypothetical protein
MHAMIGTDDVLSRLDALLKAGQIKKKDIADALGIAPQRIADLFTGARYLKLDEGQRLVEQFHLEDPLEAINAIATTPVVMMMIRYALQELAPGVVPEQSRIEDIARDCQAFLRYAADPQVLGDLEMAKAFFLARKAMETEAPKAAS